MVTVASRARAETYSGPEVVSLAHQTIDVMRIYQQTLNAQLNVDRVVPFYGDGIARETPARLQLADTRTVSGQLVRSSIALGGGSGQPKTGNAFLLSFVTDEAVAQSSSQQYQATDLNLFVSAGGAWHGLLATAGLKFDSGWSGLDSQNRFSLSTTTAAGAPPQFRPGTPPQFADLGTPSVAVRRKGAYSGVLTLEHREGFSLGTVLGEVDSVAPDGTITRKTALTTLRGLVKPEDLWKRLELSKYGVPLTGLDVIARDVDYYGDRYRATRQALLAAAPVPQAPRLPTYEIPLGLDDIGELGLHVKAIGQVSPTPLFRGAEGGWAKTIGNFDGAARAFTFRRAASYTESVEIAARYLFGGWFGLGASYSYNTPDASTFFPIPNASVFGVQVSIGPAFMIRPIVPIAVKPEPAAKPVAPPEAPVEPPLLLPSAPAPISPAPIPPAPEAPTPAPPEVPAPPDTPAPAPADTPAPPDAPAPAPEGLP
ncbi:MAG TPA: hypothetical protein VGI10_24145 [Polyangiaceae bacterium]